MSDEEKEKEALVDASMMALGFIIAKAGVQEPVAHALAFALKRNGVESPYIDEILNVARIKHGRFSANVENS